MSWASLPPDLQATAQAVLTRKQLDVWKLHVNGTSSRRISVMLNLSRTTIEDHLDAAHLRLRKAGVHRDDAGNYYQQEAA